MSEITEIETINVYSVTVISDFDRSSKVLGYYSTYDIASEAANGSSQWGSDGTISGPLEVVKITCMSGKIFHFLLNDAIDIKTMTPSQEKIHNESIKKSALSKLSDEEKKVLGL